jgi:hypothetical protein
MNTIVSVIYLFVGFCFMQCAESWQVSRYRATARVSRPISMSADWIPLPSVESRTYSDSEPTYTILGHPSRSVKKLLLELRRNKINYVFIDKGNFPRCTLDTICRKYMGDENLVPTDAHYRETQVFFQTDFYVGSMFEMYEIIAKHTMEADAPEKKEILSFEREWSSVQDLEDIAALEDEENPIPFK